ncbi:unnamed protein product [Chironomus riparius]|uniref:Uncharacterized protein n=1 Tax=Chironomus riparius TaxID=315576 RepID=A0A9N9S6G6_9DIPT|nr:unnamed protein product [Chironomus riparius]
MADVEETGKVVGITYRVLSVLVVLVCIIGFILGIHWLFLSIFVVIAVILYFAATRFVVAIRTNNSRQTIFFIVISVILLVVSGFYFYLLLESLIAGDFSGYNPYYFYPSPVVFLIQFFTVYVAFKVRSSIVERTESLKLNA